jgi:predicted AAA+ superfamily ATPase
MYSIMTYMPREITPAIISALDDMPVIAITGMRQTGKSTFLQQQAELQGRKYITLDDFAQLAAARANPDGFIETDKPHHHR